MQKLVPFYSNTPDDTHCFQASLKMVLKYFLPDKDFSFGELDRLTDKKEGLWTWPIRAVINLFQMEFEVIDADYFSFEKFIDNPEEYLIARYGKEVGDAQIKHSDISAAVKDCQDYLKLGIHEERIPKLKEIKQLLDKGFLVICNVNSQALHSKVGYVGHFVVIYSYSENGFELHDPGLPATQGLKVSFQQFEKGWGYPDERSSNLLALKHAKRN